MLRAIIYYRKSTDRDDKQVNSLEHQLTNCRNTAKNLWFEVVREIGESVSAKEEFKRPGFNEMIEICKKKKADFIIIDEPKRLSRNNIDTSRIIDLMDKKCLMGIYATSRQYASDNSRDKFLLQLDLSLSKMDNEDRAKDTKDKMITCLRNGKCMYRVPFGYKNITIRKGHKDVIVDEQKREAIKTVFEMRKKSHPLPYISEHMKKHFPYIGKISEQLLKKMLVNKFYYGIMTFWGTDYPGNHEPLISKKLFDEANDCGRGGFIIVNKGNEFLLKWLLRDPSRMKMVSYVKKGHTYHNTQTRSEYRINIREDMIFEKAGEYLKQYEGWSRLQELNKKIILETIKEYESSSLWKIEEIDKQMIISNKRKSELLNFRLDGKISDEIYMEKLNEITNDIFGLEESKNIYRNQDGISKLYEKMIELSKSLYQAYNQGDKVRRALILKNVMIELLVDNKKELSIAENELFSVVKYLGNFYGDATESWTPLYGMKTRCPNR